MATIDSLINFSDETQLDMQPGEDCANPLAKLELCTRDVIT